MPHPGVPDGFQFLEVTNKHSTNGLTDSCCRWSNLQDGCKSLLLHVRPALHPNAAKSARHPSCILLALLTNGYHYPVSGMTEMPKHVTLLGVFVFPPPSYLLISYCKQETVVPFSQIVGFCSQCTALPFLF